MLTGPGGAPGDGDRAGRPGLRGPRRLLRRGGPEAARAVERGRVPAVREARDLDARARMRRVDEPSVADVEPDVTDTVEEDQVARPQPGARDAPPAVELLVRRSGQVDPEVAVHEADEPGAVEARARRGAAPPVRDAEQVPGEDDGPFAERRTLDAGVGGGRPTRGCRRGGA